MATTTLDLFRVGNKTSARFHNVRPGEVAIYDFKGTDFVVGRSGGMSTFDAPAALSGTWYRLPKGTTFDDAVFFLWSDYPGHWSWEPQKDMPLAEYIVALMGINAEFVPV